MPVFKSNARMKADRLALAAGLTALVLSVALVISGAVNPTGSRSSGLEESIETTSTLPGDPETVTVITEPAPGADAAGNPQPVKVTTVTEGGSPGSIVESTKSTTAATDTSPLGLLVGNGNAGLLLQLLLAVLFAFLVALATQRALLGEYGIKLGSYLEVAPLAPLKEAEAAAARKDTIDAGEVPKGRFGLQQLVLRPRLADPRLRVLGLRIDLELTIRALAARFEIRDDMTIRYVIKKVTRPDGLSPKLSKAVTALIDIGDRVARGAEFSVDTAILLEEAYDEAIKKVAG